MMSKTKKWTNELITTAPSFFWLTLFFVIPSAIILTLSFKPVEVFGKIKEGWTLSMYTKLLHPQYLYTIGRTLWFSLLTTLFCIALALPVGYQLALLTPKLQKKLLLFIIVPFWSSFLIRIFSWKAFLHPEGPLKKILVYMHLIEPDQILLYNSFSVILVMVYSYLPFAIIPIYSAASKFNFQLMEAAMDLGATRLFAFYKIFLPGIQKGVLNALIMVFVPAIGAYVIPDLVGGTQSEMIGNKIAQKTLIERNLPLASSLATVLGGVILLPLLTITWIKAKGKLADKGTKIKE